MLGYLLEPPLSVLNIYTPGPITLLSRSRSILSQATDVNGVNESCTERLECHNSLATAMSICVTSSAFRLAHFTSSGAAFAVLLIAASFFLWFHQQTTLNFTTSTSHLDSLSPHS